MTTQNVFQTQHVDDVAKKAKEWALAHGLIRPVIDRNENDPDTSIVTHFPFMLTPSPMPRSLFEKMKQTQLDFNKLMYHVSRDYEFLRNVLKNSLEYDDFTRRLVEICKQLDGKRIKDRGTLDIIRCDYMLDGRSEEQRFKQVEINTIAAGAAVMATLVAPLHRYTLKLLGKYEEANRVPDNQCLEGIATALVRAWKVYGQPNACILLVAEATDIYVFPHRHIEFKIHEIDPRIPFMKANLGDIGMRASLMEDQELNMDGFEVAVVYYRTGYGPHLYKSEMEWNGRLVAEQSCAIKCPSIGGHLAGTKTVQQALSEPGVVERFIDDPEAVDRIRDTFCRLYSLDLGSKGDHAVNMAIENPDKFVLKPNREAGGNNLFGNDVFKKLTELKGSPERAKYILMDKIEPVKIKGYPVSILEPTVILQEMTYELGIYGAIVGDTNEIVHTRQVGHLLRTKPSSESEGSLSTGRCVVDSPILTM